MKSEIGSQAVEDRLVALEVMGRSVRKSRRRRRKAPPKRRTTPLRGGGFDLQKLLAKTGLEFLWPGYQYMGPGTHLAKRLKRGDPGINR